MKIYPILNARPCLVFGISRTTAFTTIKDLLPLVSDALVALVIKRVTHEDQDMKNQLLPSFRNVTMIGDCTVQPCSKPSGSFKDAKLYYSKKTWVLWIENLQLAFL